MDISLTQSAVWDCISRITLHLANRVANRLSKKLKTVGLAYMSHNPEYELPQHIKSMCAGRLQYLEAARPNIEPYDSQGPSSVYLRNQDAYTKNKTKTLSLY